MARQKPNKAIEEEVRGSLSGGPSADRWEGRLLSAQARLCRACKRPNYWYFKDKPRSAIGALGAALGKFRNALMSPDDTPILDLIMAKLKERGQKVGLNTIRTFLNGKYSAGESSGVEDWIDRAKSCLEVILRNDPTDNGSSKIAREITDFLFPPNEGPTKESWFSRSDLKDCPNPMSDREVEAEIRAILYFAKQNRPTTCRIVRASGHQRFHGTDAIRDLTVQCVELKVPVIYFVPEPKGGAISPSEQSAMEFTQSLLASRIESDSFQILRVNRSQALDDNRHISDYLSPNFRWGGYVCPTDDGTGAEQKSLVVIRTLDEMKGRYAFSPSRREIDDFFEWVNLAKASAKEVQWRV